MRLALCTVCPDARQQQLLDIVWTGWEAFAKKHSLPIRVIEEPPPLESPYWGKYTPFQLPDLREFDAVLMLDNDVVISPEAPLPSEGWDGERVRCVDERAQFPHNQERFEPYYRDYDLEAPEPSARVLNTGVLLFTRDHAKRFLETYEQWRDWRAAYRLRHGGNADVFRLANDQPHVSHALLRSRAFEELDPQFNRLWWAWWEDGGRRQELPLKIYAKAVQILARALPRTLLRPLAAPGGAWWRAALRKNHFIHVAGSKSPISLYRWGR
ncbi:MAG: hypothetical protein JSR82_15760 [Verrucomicrobia bacterium]|nr:hypothetical protein [Verrucomicrobiota bacterium]